MKILLVRFSALGDVILTTGIIEMIKKMRPDVEIDFATSTGLAPVFEGNDKIAKVHTIDKKADKKEYQQLARSLPKYDHIFDLHGTLKATQFTAALEGQLHRVQKQSFIRRLYVKTRLYGNKLKRHVVQKYAECCLPVLGIHTFSIEDLRPVLTRSKNYQSTKEKFSLPDKYVVIHPYASQKNKEWPYFSDLCDKLNEFNITPVVIGTGQQQWPSSVIDLSQKTEINEMKDVIAGAGALVTTDSGPLHIGTALYRPTITIFGPTTRELGFMPAFKKTFVFENSTLSCRPCHVHGGNSCPKRHFKCMKSIEVPGVFSKVCEFF